MTTRTQWFKNRKPVNVGDYEWHPSLSNPVNKFMWLWNGREWGYSENGMYCKCVAQNPTWRGLAVKPKSGIKTRKPQAK